MATVRLAVGTGGELLAVKALHRHLQHDARLRRLFDREARVHALVSSPHVCAFRGRELGEPPRLTLEYVRGLSLQTVLQPLHEQGGLASALPIALDLLDAVSSVHSATFPNGQLAQIVHGDIAADNVLIRRDGVSKLIDFGVATFVENQPLGSERGRAAYLSPERLRGEGFDQRADQWSLAVLFVELLTGEHPFRRASEIATFHAIAEADVAPPSSQGGLSALKPLDATLLRALSKDPADRFDDVHAFASSLRSQFPPEAADRSALSAFLQEHVASHYQPLFEAEKRVRASE